MPVCTFWGHRDCADDIYPILEAAIQKLVTECDVNLFYVGNQGQFDAMVRRALRRFTAKRPTIHYAVVLAYMPNATSGEDFSDTMLPEGIETTHPRYAITRRNDWMLAQCDYVIAYITRPWGGAARYVQKAQRQNKTVINIAEIPTEPAI